MLSVSIPDEKGESELINTTLVAFEARNPLEVGGVVVWRKNTIEIFGETFRAFKLSKSFSFNKNTRLEVKLDNVNDAQMTGVCVYETLESANNMKQCVHLPTEVGQVDINVGFLLNDRRANIEFIAFIQANPALLEYGTSVSEIAFVQGENTDIIDEDGECKDPNASTTMLQNGNITCICDVDYVSSGGGNEQRELDSCISCVSSPYCFFEGDYCSGNVDCNNEICDDGICKTTVSSSVPIILIWSI
jgi:hypothetical protein